MLSKLGDYMLSGDAEWVSAKEKAFNENGWFTPEFISLQVSNIASAFLPHQKLSTWAQKYQVPDQREHPMNIGIIMAGNLPLVGFHDFLATFISGHRQTIKLSSKDTVLPQHLINKLAEWDSDTASLVGFSTMLKGCDAYIATGSNNSSRYFEYYFQKYPHIIRRNRSSVAILDGEESAEDLEKLASDVYAFFGLGCRNVTKLFVPKGYDFVPLLDAFRKYNYIFEHHKYRNNYDYQLAILIINKLYYMTNGSIILVENPSIFSPISVLHYEFYEQRSVVESQLEHNSDVQCIVGKNFTPFGEAQCPTLNDFADGVDTMAFLSRLGN